MSMRTKSVGASLPGCGVLGKLQAATILLTMSALMMFREDS